jgi:phage shock protein PspC (stress-responsive transcriptional regulator)
MRDVNGTRKLMRTREGRMVAGVCSGIGEYLGVDANVIRLVLALITVITAGSGVLLYLAAWVVVPEEDEPTSIAEKMIKKYQNG